MVFLDKIIADSYSTNLRCSGLPLAEGRLIGEDDVALILNFVNQRNGPKK
jgi:hypothetical protein